MFSVESGEALSTVPRNNRPRRGLLRHSLSVDRDGRARLCATRTCCAACKLQMRTAKSHQTTFPGCYSGRYPRIHFEIFQPVQGDAAREQDPDLTDCSAKKYLQYDVQRCERLQLQCEQSVAGRDPKQVNVAGEQWPCASVVNVMIRRPPRGVLRGICRGACCASGAQERRNPTSPETCEQLCSCRRAVVIHCRSRPTGRSERRTPQYWPYWVGKDCETHPR